MRKIILCIGLFVSFAASAECRSAKIRHEFEVQQGYPHGRKGWIIDHTCPLFCSGKDSVSNMAYQTIKEAKAKDRWETTPAGCKLLCNKSNSTYPVRRVFNCKS